MTLYAVDSRDPQVIERIWQYTQYSGTGVNMPMYRARIARAHVAWCVEINDAQIMTMFLLQFAPYVSMISGLHVH